MTYYDDLLAVGIGAVVTGLLLWFFFGPKRAKTTELRGGVQEVEVTVRGGYSPDVIRAQRGVPLRLIFDRQEAGDCSSRVLFSDFGVSASLPAFERTTVDLVPDEVGEFGFACGMNMIHGRLLVEEPDTASDDVTAGRPTAEAEPALHEVRQADFALQGMSCASCVGRIESAIGAVPGVDDVAVNFGTERASVVFDPAVASPGAIVAAVEAIGYHAHERDALATTDGEDRERASRRAEIRDRRRTRLAHPRLAARDELAAQRRGQRLVVERWEAWQGEPAPPAVVEAAEGAAGGAEAEVLPALRELLALDVDEQGTNPLWLVRRAVTHATAALAAAGVPPVVRDEHAERLFPDDRYDLVPGAFGDLDPSVHEPGLVWGAAKAHVILRRRRADAP